MHEADEDVAGFVVLVLKVLSGLIEKVRVAGFISGDKETGRFNDGETVIVFV